MGQRITSSDKYLSVMQFFGDGTGQQLFAIDDVSAEAGYPEIDVRVAMSRHASNTMLMTPDIALAAYEWLGRWLQAQGVKLPAPDTQLPTRV